MVTAGLTLVNTTTEAPFAQWIRPAAHEEKVKVKGVDENYRWCSFAHPDTDDVPEAEDSCPQESTRDQACGDGIGDVCDSDWTQQFVDAPGLTVGDSDGNSALSR